MCTLAQLSFLIHGTTVCKLLSYYASVFSFKFSVSVLFVGWGGFLTRYQLNDKAVLLQVYVNVLSEGLVLINSMELQNSK